MAAEGHQAEPSACHRTCLLLLLLLLAQLAGTQAGCFFQAQAPCLYKERRFAPGEAWRDTQCLKCFCLYPFSVGCCNTMLRPVDFPDWCKVCYDFQTCEVSLVQKMQPRRPCVDSLENEWGSADHPGWRSEQPGRQTVPPTQATF